MKNMMQKMNIVSVASDRTMRTACSASYFAVRFFAYCFFYYFYYFKSNKCGKRMQAFAA